MSDIVFIDSFNRYGWTEECIDLDDVAYVDFEKCQICFKAHGAQIPRTIQTTLDSLYRIKKALLKNIR